MKYFWAIFILELRNMPFSKKLWILGWTIKSHKKGHILNLSEMLKCAQKLHHLLITWWVCRVLYCELWDVWFLYLMYDVVCLLHILVCAQNDKKVFVEKVADTFFYPILLWGWEFSWVCVHGYGSWSFEKWFLSVKRDIVHLLCMIYNTCFLGYYYLIGV